MHERVVRHFVTLFVIRWPLLRGLAVMVQFRCLCEGGKEFIGDASSNPKSTCDAWILRKSKRDSWIYELAWNLMISPKSYTQVEKFETWHMSSSQVRAWNGIRSFPLPTLPYFLGVERLKAPADVRNMNSKPLSNFFSITYLSCIRYT